MELVCGHGNPIKRNNVDELVEGNGGANETEIGQMKSRHRKRARQWWKEWLHECRTWRRSRHGKQRWDGRRRWHGRQSRHG